MFKVYIAETATELDKWCRENKEKKRGKIFVLADDTEKLMGLDLESWAEIKIIGDPKMRFSFWRTLISRIR